MESACIVLTDIRRCVRFHGVPGAMREANPGTRAGNMMNNRAHSRSASMPVTRPPLSPGYIDAVAVQERDLNSDSDFGDANEVVYYHANTLFSVYALTDATENVVERYRYDAYGACTVLDDDWSADADGLSDVQNPYTFTGRRLDDETGLLQYRHRSYSPHVGRFISRDSVGYLDGLHTYLYTASDPVQHADPLGLTCWFRWTSARGYNVRINYTHGNEDTCAPYKDRLKRISDALRKEGMNLLGVDRFETKATFSTLKRTLPLPVCRGFTRRPEGGQ